MCLLDNLIIIRNTHLDDETPVESVQKNSDTYNFPYIFQILLHFFTKLSHHYLSHACSSLTTARYNVVLLTNCNIILQTKYSQNTQDSLNACLLTQTWNCEATPHQIWN